jgi:hypothetical protein
MLLHLLTEYKKGERVQTIFFINAHYVNMMYLTDVLSPDHHSSQEKDTLRLASTRKTFYKSTYIVKTRRTMKLRDTYAYATI